MFHDHRRLRREHPPPGGKVAISNLVGPATISPLILNDFHRLFDKNTIGPARLPVRGSHSIGDQDSAASQGASV